MAHTRLPNSDDLCKSWMVLPLGEDTQKSTPGEEAPAPHAVTGLPSDHDNEEPHTSGIKDRVIWLVSSVRVVFMRLVDAVHLTPILAYFLPKTFGLPPPLPLANQNSRTTR